MKRFIIVVICLGNLVSSFGQDGGDMLYIKTEKLDNSFVGRLAQLDFYNKSNILKTTWDTVDITINNKNIKFAEHREDDGLNKWFYRQYLESVEYAGDYKMRLVKNRIDAVTQDSVQVTSYFDFYSKSGALAAGKSIQQRYWFSRKMISQVLVMAEKRDM